MNKNREFNILNKRFVYYTLAPTPSEKYHNLIHK